MPTFAPAFAPAFRLGFDGGGTKTRAVIIDKSARIVGAGESGASNPYAVGMKAALAQIEIAANFALLQANLSREEITGWGLGLGGVCSESESAEVEIALRKRIGSGPKIVAVEDVVAAWSGAFGGAGNWNDPQSERTQSERTQSQPPTLPRAVCIAGTGANCWGQNARGETAQADGAGPILGDRGSGYWIGEHALRYAARVLDGVLKPDAFSSAILNHLGAPDLKALIRLIYAPAAGRSPVAALVPIVLEHAQNHVAREILSGAGRELALTSLSVLRRLSQSEVSGEVALIGGEVALIGGVLAYAAPVKTAFVEELQSRAPQARLVAARFEPAIGAALLV